MSVRKPTCPLAGSIGILTALTCYASDMDPLHATIEEFAADGYTHIECHCPRCRANQAETDQLSPAHLDGLTIAQLSARLRCFECGAVALSQAVAAVVG